MKKTRSSKRSHESDDEMKSEYHFDYSKARPNRFATSGKVGTRAIVLDPDVAKVFTTGESVNTVLRALIEAMPQNDAR